MPTHARPRPTVPPGPILDKHFEDASHCRTFVDTLFANVNNAKLTDEQFRQFVRNTLEA